MRKASSTLIKLLELDWCMYCSPNQLLLFKSMVWYLMKDPLSLHLSFTHRGFKLKIDGMLNCRYSIAQEV